VTRHSVVRTTRLHDRAGVGQQRWRHPDVQASPPGRGAVDRGVQWPRGPAVFHRRGDGYACRGGPFGYRSRPAPSRARPGSMGGGWKEGMREPHRGRQARGVRAGRHPEARRDPYHPAGRGEGGACGLRAGAAVRAERSPLGEVASLAAEQDGPSGRRVGLVAAGLQGASAGRARRPAERGLSLCGEPSPCPVAGRAGIAGARHLVTRGDRGAGGRDPACRARRQGEAVHVGRRTGSGTTRRAGALRSRGDERGCCAAPSRPARAASEAGL